MTQSQLRRIGIVLAIAGLAITLAFPFFSGQLVNLLENTISPDGDISAGGRQQLAIALLFGCALLTVLGVLLLVYASDGPWKRKIADVIVRDPLFPTGTAAPSPVNVLLFTTLVGVLLTVSMSVIQPENPLFGPLYLEDGVMENLTAAAFIAAAFFTGRAALRAKQDLKNDYPKWLWMFLALAAVGFFVIGAEEISWGQRIIGWSTPEVFKDTNVQDETNLHNVFNSIFPIVYRFPVVLPLILLAGVWLEAKQKWLTFSRFVLPAFSLFGLSVVIAFVALMWGHQELLEELAAVFVLFYSYRLYRATRVLKKVEETAIAG